MDLRGKNDGDTVVASEKTYVKYLMPDLRSKHGLVLEKIESLAHCDDVTRIVNDNDGLDDHPGEMQLLEVELPGIY